MPFLLPFVAGRGPIVPVLRLSGAIGMGGRGGISLESLAQPIQRAFAFKRSPVVALSINSPGGSAAQSSLIAGRIRGLASEKGKKVVAFVEDVAASGGYWLACAADEIFIDPSSIVGSIGVISAGFGLQDAIGRLGIERRVHTAGARKGLLDPFRPERPEDLELLREIQGQIHERFIAHVRDRRGERLKGGEELFDGRVFVGERAVAIGLADGIGDVRGTLRRRFGEKVRFVGIGPKRGWLQRRLRSEFDAGHMLASAVTALEERALWQRYGL